ncbi:MAG: YafY family transcriptional regulator [Burkholderiaceae bacterium]|nr:YafY family transcriptional regulator [Burkholderiaceae bacterium]
MDRTERFYKIDQMIHDRKLVPFADLMAALEVSRATLKRDLEYMRNRLNAPIVWDRDGGTGGGYRFDTPHADGGGQYELPGLWFNSGEVHALLTMQHLLTDLDPGGILTPHIQPLIARLNSLLGSAENTADEIRRRVLIVGLGKRDLKLAHFEKVGAALLRRKRLAITYFARGSGETTEREVSPQRLVYYRENWYLDAWCHLRNDIRNFALDSIRHAEVIETKAREVSRRSMDEVLGPGYGIFSGRKLQHAKLRFTPQRARWVAQETWHPKQKGSFDADGSWRLEFPYADHRELIMDILKFGADVEVLAPPDLRQRLADEGARLTLLYAAAPKPGKTVRPGKS